MALYLPVTSLINQQSQLSALHRQIAAIKQQEKNLASTSLTMRSQSNAILQAREQYQLVLPGQSLIQVLPGKIADGVSSVQSDPGSQPLAEPQSLVAAGVSTPAASHHGSSFVARFLRTLEFWR